MRRPSGWRSPPWSRSAKEVGRDKVAISIGYVGLIPSSYPINAIYQWTGGPEEAILRVAMKEGAKVDIERLKERLRRELSVQLPGVRLSFEPADIVSEVMSFGSPTPVDVAVTGPNLADDRAFAEKLRNELGQIPSLRDLHYGQSLDYPTINIEVDRERAGLSGVTAADVARSVVAATSSSRFMVPNYWPDPKTGIGYQVQVEIPYQIMDTLESIETVPIQRPGLDRQILLRDVAQVRPGTMPGEYDRYNMKRSVSLTANIAGEDLGRIAGHVERAIGRAGAPPKGATVDVRGQIRPMEEILQGLGDRPGDVNRRHPAAADGELPVGQARPDRRLDHARGGRRRRAHAVAHRDNGQPPVVHGVDHGHRRGGRQRDSAGDVRRAAPPRGGCGGRAGRHGRREGPAPAHPDDQLRDDRRHGSDGAGMERGERADRPARPRGHRRPGRRDHRDPDRAPDRLRAGPGLGGSGVGLARSRRPREHALPRRGSRGERDGPAVGQRRAAGSPTSRSGG